MAGGQCWRAGRSTRASPPSFSCSAIRVAHLISSTSSSERALQRPRSLSWRKIVRVAGAVLVVFIAANTLTWWTSGYFQREATYRDEVSAVASHPDVHI